MPTHCLYPSNGVVRVYVSGGGVMFVSDGRAEFKVHDGGGALDEFEAGGGYVLDEVSIIRGIARAQGLNATNEGVIFSPPVTVDQLVGTIALVANSSKESAHALVDRHHGKPKKNFREALARIIDIERARGIFVEVSSKRAVSGASSKQHKFDYEFTLSGKRRLLLDAVCPEASSINSVLAANIDVKQADPENTLQRIVYDDEDNWKAADLSLLGIGATVVPFTKLRPVLERLAR